VTDAVVLAVHGGAGGFREPPSDELVAECHAGLRDALEAGRILLDGTGDPLDAVEAAVAALEDAAVFNAGRGAVYTVDATQELEAAVMVGATRDAGAVASVGRVRNPVHLARLVMERSPHVMLAGPPAELFAREHGATLVDGRYFHTERRLRALLEGDHGWHGTVGAVARGPEGTLAAATSTGGTTGKWAGRVGDTPLIGAGTYADARVAVSTTGHGEFFVRTAAARTVAALIEHAGLDVDAAARRTLADVAALGGSGGLIALTAAGDLAMPFDTGAMHRGYLTTDGEITTAIT
jgi:L-asparaginase / beta-aspartyl-peptidase